MLSAKLGAGNGANTIVTGKAGFEIVLCGIYAVASGDVNVYWSSSGGTNLIGDATNIVSMNTDIVHSVWFPNGVAEVPNGENLVLTLSADVKVAGAISYDFRRVI